MKHTCIPFFFLGQFLLTISLNGQNTRFLERNSFFGLKDDEHLSNQKTYEKIAVDTQIIAFRRFHPHTFAIAEEYIRYQKDTFLYRAYADTAHHVIAEGLVIYSNDYTITDTVVSFDPETYEEVFTITRYRNPLRSGFWRLETPDVYESGHYQNNVKTGEWFVREKQGFLGKYVYFGDDGRVISEEPENVVATNDIEKIKQALKGIWKLEYDSCDNCWNYTRVPEIKRARYQTYIAFNEPLIKHESIKERDYRYEKVKLSCQNQHFLGDWAMLENDTMMICPVGYLPKIFKILFISRTRLSLEILE